MAYNSIYMVKSSLAHVPKSGIKRKSITSSTYVIHNLNNNLKKKQQQRKTPCNNAVK